MNDNRTPFDIVLIDFLAPFLAIAAILAFLVVSALLANFYENCQQTNVEDKNVENSNVERQKPNVPEEIVCDLIPYTFIINNFQHTFYSVECKEVSK